MATDIIARGMASKSNINVETHTNNNDIHVTASDKSNWNNKLDKNQGSENSGKVLGTNANGEVIPLNGYGFEYDEETKMLKYGTDPTSNLNQGIGLDDTLSKRGYAADAGAVGELKSDLSEISGKTKNLVYNIPTFTLANSGTKIYGITQGFDNLEVGIEYTFSVKLDDVVPSTSSNNNLVFRCVYPNNTYIQIIDTISGGWHSYTFTPQKRVYQLYFSISASSSSDTTLTFSQFQLEKGGEFSGYLPYITAYDAEARNIAKEALDNQYNQYVHNEGDLIKAISVGGIITLMADINISNTIIFNKNIILYGGGHSINGTRSIESVAKATGGKLTMHDTKFSVSSDSVFVFQGTSEVYAYNCDFSKSYENDGISGKEQGKGYLYNCNSHDNYDEGVSTHGASYCEVIGGEYYKNGYTVDETTKGASSSFGGVHLGGGKMGKVIGVHSHHNYTYGIGLINFQDLSSVDKETCCNNIVEDNGGAGIWCTACRDLTLSNNTIVNNGGDAIHFGLDTTYTPTVSLIKSDGVVCGNIIFRNANDNVVVDANAESSTLYIQI